MDDPEVLRQAVCHAYSEAAEHPEGDHPFPVGRAFALSLGYPAEWLDQLPADAVDAFTGVSNVSVLADIPEGATVLDVGCGAGLDSLIAARRTGPRGRVIGLDFSESMLRRAKAAARQAGVNHVEFRRADAEAMPVETGSVDVALCNGIFNLNPRREAIFRELARVVRPGGRVFAAELILREPLPAPATANRENWFA